MNYRREIDGLRALAVLPVIFFHAGFESFSGGFVGVDVFFVISGYLITGVILAELRQGSFSIVNFYERRARRIFPALFLVMLVCIPLAWLWLLPDAMKDFSNSLVAASAFASNILFLHESGYFDAAAELKPLLHTWSLAVEEQYYVLFPVVLTFAWKLGQRWMWILLTTAFVVSLLVADWMSYAKPAAAFYLIFTRSWELLIGALAALYAYKVDNTGLKFDSRAGEVGGWIGLLLIAYPVFYFSKATPMPGFYALLPTIGTALILLFASQKTTPGKFLGNKAFVGIGLISYSAYLWHQPLFAFSRHIGLRESGDIAFAALSISVFFLSYLSWRYVEIPFRNKSKFSRRQIVFFSLIGSIFFVVFGLVGNATNGFHNRMERIFGGDTGHIEFHQYIDRRYFDCEPRAIAEQALSWKGFLRCKQSKEGIPEVVFLGDSHAEHLFLGVSEARTDLNFAFYILGSKPYITNPRFKAIFDELLGNQKSQHIILTMNFVDRLNSDGYGLHEGFGATIKALLDSGKTVLLLGSVPKFKHDSGYCAYALPSKGVSPACYLDINDVTAQRSVYHLVLQRLSADYGISYVEIDKPLCSEFKCGMIKDGSVLYRDSNHLNIIGSRLVGKYVAGKLPF